MTTKYYSFAEVGKLELIVINSQYGPWKALMNHIHKSIRKFFPKARAVPL